MSNFVNLDSFAGDSSTDSTSRDATKSPSLHLGRIALPKFSGKFTEFPENFRHTFESLVESSDTLSDTLKVSLFKIGR
jgi:hypothetical protein